MLFPQLGVAMRDDAANVNIKKIADSRRSRHRRPNPIVDSAGQFGLPSNEAQEKHIHIGTVVVGLLRGTAGASKEESCGEGDDHILPEHDVYLGCFW